MSEANWDRKAAKELVDLGLSWEHARIAVGVLAEHRQQADLEGNRRGYEAGYADGVQGKLSPLRGELERQHAYLHSLTLMPNGMMTTIEHDNYVRIRRILNATKGA